MTQSEGPAEATPRPPRRIPWPVAVNAVARVVLGGVLVVAGALKVPDPVGSVLAVRAYRILPGDAAAYVGYALPWVEVAIGLMLIAGLAVRFNAVAAGALMAVFAAGIASAWARGLSIDCGCFGGGGTVAAEGREVRYAAEIARDLVLLACAAYLAAFPRSPMSVDHVISPRRGTS